MSKPSSINKDALKRYIASSGLELPVNADDFKEGGIYENNCVLCGALSSGNFEFRLPKINLIKEELIDTGCKCCPQCAIAVDNMLALNYDFYNTKRSATVFPHKSSDFSNKTRAYNFSRMLRFDPDVYKYFKHLRATIDNYISDNENFRCYICNDLLYVNRNGSMAYEEHNMSYDVPVEHSSDLFGGRINICENCYNKIDEDLDEIYTHLRNRGSIVKCKCSECGTHYYISQEENEFRAKSFHVPGDESQETMWMCPECTYSSVNSIQTLEGHPLKMEENIWPRIYPIKRFKTVMCYSCLSQFNIDLTINSSQFMATQVIEGEENFRFICRDCVTNGVMKIMQNPLALELSSREWLIFKYDKAWSYYKIRLGNPIRNELMGGQIKSIEDVFSIIDSIRKIDDG